MVSIIVPIYNVEKYLRICLDSILMQTYKDYEVILVDDGSSDKSPQICDEYCGIDSRFKVIHQENMGLASARNTGIREAKGEYVFFLDSDDCIKSNLLEIVTDIAKWKMANIVQINIATVPADYKGTSEDESSLETNYREKVREFDVIDAFYNLDRDDKSIADDIRLATTVVWTKLYRKSAFNDDSLLQPEGMRMHEDQMVAHRNIVKANGMVFLDMPLYCYRQSEASLIRVGWTSKRLAILDCYEDRLEHALLVRDKCDDANKERANRLVDYIYKRTLVCMFRNYYMVSMNLKGKERYKQHKEIVSRIKKLLVSGKGRLGVNDRIFYRLFIGFPDIFIWIFGVRERIRK